MSVLFFTCVNAAYEDFVPLYSFAVLTHIPDAKLEIGVENSEGFEARHKDAISIVRKTFGSEKFLIRSVPWRTKDGRKIVPNSVRFINVPLTSADYVYIADIDVIILDRALVSKHVKDMEQTGLPYSNSVKPSTVRMNGRHFAVMEAHYPLPDLDGFDLHTMNDEALLYKIIERKGVPILLDHQFSPTHGIHISPNRSAAPTLDKFGRRIPGWGIVGHQAAWEMLRNDRGFIQVRSFLSDRVRHCLDTIDHVIESSNEIKIV